MNFWSLDCENGDDEKYDTVVDICCDGSEFESDIDNFDEDDEDDFRYWLNELRKVEQKIILDKE